MGANNAKYPWFDTVEDDDIEQGDIFEDCPVFLPPESFAVSDLELQSAEFKWELRNLIVMSQSCDLSKGQEKVDDILLCAVWNVGEFPKDHHLSRPNGMEDARKGRLPGFHVLAESKLSKFEREVRVVDFRRVYSLPVPFMRKRAKMVKRLRLLPPYREHLSQSFARFFMRVGLPIDIPPFTKGKK